MGFRDDREALRQKTSALEQQLEETQEELERAREQLKAEKSKRRAEALGGPRLRRLGIGVIVAVAALGAVGVAVFQAVDGGAEEVEVVAARVTHSEGGAPATIGSTCELELSHARGERPPLLPAEEGCERWIGQATGGNDPTMRLVFRLCGSTGPVQGVMQWSSLRSGWSERRLQGTVTDTRMRLQETEMLEEHPLPGWGFCTVDELDLVRGEGGRLEGSFRSEACSDDGVVQLRPLSAAVSPPPTGEHLECELRLRCGAELVYGAAPPTGLIDCSVADGKIASAHDESTSDGDPTLTFDRRAARLELRGDDWSLRLELAAVSSAE